MKKPQVSPKRTLERLRSNEPASAIASSLGVRDAEVLAAREIVRHIGEHQAGAAGRLADPLAQAAVEAAVQIDHVEFLVAVAAGGGKSAASFARRALAILKSKGFDVPASPAGEAVFRADTDPLEELPCMLASPDSFGERGLWIPRALRGGGVAVTVLIVSDVHGVLHVEAGEASRKGYRKMREGIEGFAEKGSYRFIEVSLARARGIVARARAETQGGLNIAHETLVQSLIGEPGDAEPASRHAPPLDAATEGQRVSESALLHDENEIAGWLPDNAARESMALKLEELEQSSLYVNEAQRDAQRRVERLRTIESYFTPDRQRLYSGRLFEVAEVFKCTGRIASFERSTSTARALSFGGNPASIPFCTAMFDKLFAADEETNEPTDALETTKGGLILPRGLSVPPR